MNYTNSDYFTFNVHNSLLLVGETGSGKTELVRKYIRRLEQSFTPEQMQYVVYDLKQCEFNTEYEGGAKTEYLYTPIRTGKPEDMDYLEELASLSQTRADGDESKDKLLLIYIEENDLACNYTERFQAVVATICKNAPQANMKFIFSTSRPGTDFVTPDFLNSFELILCGTYTGSSKYHAETVGLPSGGSLVAYQFLVKER